MAQEVKITYTLIDRVEGPLKKLNKQLEAYEKQLDSLDKATKQLGKDADLTAWAEDANFAVRDLTDGVKGFNKSVSGTEKQKLQGYGTQVTRLGNNSATASAKVTRLANALESQNTTMGQLETKVAKYVDLTVNLGEASKATAGHLREQESALKGVRNEAVEFARAMQTITRSETQVKRAMELKNRAARDQSTHLKNIGRAADFAERRLNKGTKGVRRYANALRDASQQSAMFDGFQTGIKIPEVFTKVSAFLPAIGVAAGGLTSMLNSLGAGVVGLAGSFTSLAGSMALLPGLYASVGVAALGAQSIISTIVKPSIEGVEALKALNEQIAARGASTGVSMTVANARASDKAANAAQRTANALVDQADAQASIDGMKGGSSRDAAQARLDKSIERAGQKPQDTASAIAAAGAAASDAVAMNGMLEERALLLDGMPASAQKLVDVLEGLKTSWRAVWFGGKEKQADLIIDHIALGITGLRALMKSMTPQVGRLVSFYGRVAQYVGQIGADKGFQRLFGSVIDIAVQNLDRMLNIFKNLMPLGLGLLTVMQKFTGVVLRDIEKWSAKLDDTSIIERFTGYLERSYESLLVWVAAIRNFGGGLLNLFSGPTKAVDLFEGSLTDMTVRFNAWTEKVRDNGDAAQYFENSWKVLRGVGRVFLSIAAAFGLMGKSAKGTDSVVRFLDQLASGIERFGRYMEKAVIEFGPKMSNFLHEFGILLRNTTPVVMDMVGAILDIHTAMLDAIPDPIKKMAGYFVAASLAAGALGITLGTIAGPFMKLKSFATATVVLTGKLWGQVAATIALAKAQRGMSIPGAGKTTHFGKGLEHLDDPLSGAAKRSGAGAGVASMGAIPVAMGAGAPAATGLVATLTAALPIIAAVAVVVALLGAAFLAFKDNVGGVANRMKGTLSVVFGDVKDKLDKLSESLGFGKDAFKAVASGVKGAGKGFMFLFKWLGVVVLEVGRFAAIFTGALFGVIIANITSVVNIVKDLAKSFMNIFKADGFVDTLKALGGFVFKFLSAPFRALGSFVKNVFAGLRDVVVGSMYSILDNIPDVLIDFLPGNIDAAIDKYKEAEAKAKQLGKDEDNAENAAAATGARYTGLAAQYGVKPTPAKKKKDASLSSAVAVDNMPGYTETTKKGAAVKWDLATVASFNSATKGIEKVFMNLMARIKRLPAIMKLGMEGMLAAIKEKKSPLVEAMKDLGKSMTDPLRSYLRKVVDEVNAIVTATGGSPISPFGGMGDGGGGAAATTKVAGDAPASSPGSVARALVGNSTSGGAVNWGGHPAANAGLIPFVQAANALGVMVSSTTGGTHAAGSQHYSGDAVDLSNGSSPTPEMDKLYASLVPYAKSGAISQLIYRDHFWDNGNVIGGIGGHDNHVHVGLGTGGAGEVQLANMMADLTKLPNFSGFGAEAMTGLGNMAYEALTGFGKSGGTPSMEGSAASGGAKGIAQAMMGSFGFGPDQFSALDKLWTRESNWKWNADNPNSDAYGIPQCVDLHTKILTRRGWLMHDEVEVGDETIGYNPETGKNEWTEVVDVLHPGKAEVFEFGISRWKARSTGNHRWLMDLMVEDRPREREMVELQHHEGRRHRIVVAVEADTESTLDVTTEEAALLAWIAGDGWQEQARPEIRRPTTFFVSQTKQQHWDHIEESLGDPTNWSVTRTRKGHREWRLAPAYARDLLRRAGNPKTDAVEQVLCMNAEQRAAWLGAMLRAEGYEGDGYTQYSQKAGPVAEAIKLAIYLQGQSPSVYRDERNLSQTEGDRAAGQARRNHTILTISPTQPYVGMRNATVLSTGAEEVWCVTTALGTWTASQDDRVFLTGNSLPGSKMASAGTDWLTNPATQIKWGLGYIKDRYGSPDKAWDHSEAVNWYGNGGSFITNGPQVIGVGDKQREHVQVTPMTGPKAAPAPGRVSSSAPAVHSTVVIQGGVFTTAESLQNLANQVGTIVSKDVIQSLRSHANQDI